MTVGTYASGPTVVEAAADGAEELGFLAAVMADPVAETPRLVYADWLDDRDDPRGAFLRAFVEAARDPAAPLPPGGEYPMPWRQLAGVWPRHTLRAAFADETPPAGVPVEQIEYELMRRARPALHLLAVPADDADLPPGCSKFGGRPDLPVGAEWPVAPDTHSDLSRGLCWVAVFCAQLRLSDLCGTLVGRELPPAGVLSFFNTPFNWSPVRLTHAGEAVRRPDPPPDPTWDEPDGGYFPREFYPLPAASVRLIEGIDLPLGREFNTLPAAFWNEVDAGWLEDRLALRPAAFEWGVPHHQLLGYGREANAYPNHHWRPGVRRLATFGSDGESPYYWGDSAQPYWYITQADLDAGDFGNVTCQAG